MFTNADDAILATLDAIKSICELLFAKNLISVDELAHRFHVEGSAYVGKRNLDMAAVMILLLQYIGRSDTADQLQASIDSLRGSSL